MIDPFVSDGTSLTWRGSGETLRIQPWGADSVRVRAVLGGPLRDSDWALLEPEAPAEGRCAVVIDGDTATITNGAISVLVRSNTGLDWQGGYIRTSAHLTFLDAHGEVLFAEEEHGGALKLRARDYDALPGGTFRARATFTPAPGEKLYGMGQYQQDILNIKGATFELAHRNSQVSVPFVLSSAGYGFLWHNPAIGRATFATNRTEWFAESTAQLDYWVTAGATPSDISRNYAQATGHAPMMPEHGLGFWQCKLRYTSQEELLNVAREHKRRELPMDVIVADFFHWPKMGDFRFEDEFWPDPEAMVAELAELGIELMVSVWPQVSLESENFAELDQLGYLVRSNRGVDIQMAFEGPSRFLDVTNPGAREWLWAKLRVNYPGVKLFWLDEAEPEYAFFEFGAYSYHAGQVLEVGNVYPQLFSRAVYDGQISDGQGDSVNLVRCAWAGSQRYGALVWSGDIHSSFASMRRQVTAGIHMGVAGIPWFTTDIGGFGGGNIDDPAFRELLVRWFQMGAFMPVMRLHGDRGPSREIVAADGSRRCHSGAENELWSYGEEVYEILARYVNIREDLREYTRGVMTAAHTDGQPVMRGLFHDFPSDEQAWDVADQFLFGPSLLVAPVLEAGVRRREVYLPAGASWTALASGEVFDGGRWVQTDAPLGVIPVFARDAALPQLVGTLA